MSPNPVPFPRKFWDRVDRRGDDECWPWIGSGNGHGYGCAWHEGRNLIARRLSYELLVGPIPEGMTVDHECHNRGESCAGGETCPHRMCVNPRHLIPRTSGDNARRAPLTQVGKNVRKT